MATSPQGVTVSGIVGPQGSTGFKSRGARFWTMHLWLQPWRHPRGYIEERPIWIRRSTASQLALRSLIRAIKPNSVMRLQVHRLSRKPDSAGRYRATLVKSLGQDRSDKELAQRLSELKKPVKVKDPFFGTLKLNRKYDQYETRVPWNGRRIELELVRREGRDENDLFRLAEKMCKAQKRWDRRIRDYATAKLLLLKNDTWLLDGEKRLTQKEFKERLKLFSVNLDHDGHFAFWFHDGDLFCGHLIQVKGTLSEGPKDVDIPG